jgi:mannose-6-phosphate isomerase-like protein (cupin superfamily)
MNEKTEQVSAPDVALLTQLLEHSGGILQSEQSHDEQALDAVIEKPWGYEYRVYTDCFYDVWQLCLRPGQSTSLHCHPRKVTALICLAGELGRVRLLDQDQQLTPLEWLTFGKGVFHTTENLGDGDLDLLEVEVPRNKLDLLRAMDRYDRAIAHYERTPLPVGVPGMEAGMHIRPYKLRASGVKSAYRFAVQTGREIQAQRQAEPRLSVALGTAQALQQDIQVLRSHRSFDTLHPEEMYFTISFQAQ